MGTEIFPAGTGIGFLEARNRCDFLRPGPLLFLLKRKTSSPRARVAPNSANSLTKVRFAAGRLPSVGGAGITGSMGRLSITMTAGPSGCVVDIMASISSDGRIARAIVAAGSSKSSMLPEPD